MKTEFDHELTAVIADDEVLARKRIRHLLAKRSDIRVVAECVHGYDVCDKVLEYKPDLLFLDIQMPEMDGLEVLRTLGPVAVPGVVFVTAFDQHAIRAFELHALDYLLKPFDDARFYEALDRAIQMIGKQQLPDNLKRLLQNLPRPEAFMPRIPVKDGIRIHFVETANILWIEATGKNTMMHTTDGSIKTAKNIIEVARDLDPTQFYRIHRSYIVNIRAIREMQSWHKGEYVVILSDATRLVTGRAFRGNVDLLMRR